VLGAVAAVPAAAAGPAPGSPDYVQRDTQNMNDAYGRITGPGGQLQNPNYLPAMVLESNQLTANQLLDQAATPTRLAITPGNVFPGWNVGNPLRRGWNGKRGQIVRISYTNRYGALIRGDVFSPLPGARDPYTGAALKPPYPGVVITTGSVQGSERMYWWLAEDLAERGYVVMTYDVQGQGYSDRQGAAPDQDENAQAQDPNAFLDGARDSLDFFLSRPDRKYAPRPSRTSGTSHADKQDRRVASGLNAAFNPLWDLVDPERIGIAGHSLGAFAVSDFGSKDKRVDAIVAWDNLAIGGGSMFGQAVEPIKPRVPALGMSNDYGLTPTPYGNDPDPQGKSAASVAWSKAGVDTGQINIRGGTHYEYAYIPNPGFGATLRGMDLAAWYTGAWFDKYVKGDPTADRRLLTTRWRDDEQGKGVDSSTPPDGNLFSFYLRSRLDIGLSGGTRFKCEDLRAGCPGQAGDDGEARPYSYLAASTTKDSAAVGDSTGAPGGGTCVRSIAVPKRVSLARSGRRVSVGLVLDADVRAEAGLRDRGARRKLRARTRARIKAGRRTIVLRVSRDARPGGYRLSLRLGCGREKIARGAKVTLVP
jgi:dienelactone hydrolase